MDLLYVQTPILQSLNLTKELGIPVFLKMEALQPTGSFWVRAAGLLISDYVANGKNLFVAAPANLDEALALAHACRVLNCELKLVFPPKKLSSLIKKKIQQEGAEILEEGSDFKSAEIIAKGFAGSKNFCYIDFKNSPIIRDGISTLIYEIFGAGLKPGAILLYPTPSLLLGVLQGFKNCKWGDIPIITAESAKHCPFATALFSEKNEAEGFDPELLKKIKNHTLYPHIVEDQDAMQAAFDFANEERVLIEPSQASPLVLAQKNLPLLKTFSSVLVIVSGAADVSLSTFKHFLLK